MSKKIKLALLASLAVIGVVGGGVGSAQAATTAACQFTGTTTSLLPPVQLTGGSGTFAFSGGANCSVNGGAPEAGTIDAQGSYTNVVCGTGTATGTATIATPSATVNVSFTITFAAGNGALQGTGSTTGAGYVNIRPHVPGGTGTPPNCVTQFDVAGAFAGQA